MKRLRTLVHAAIVALLIVGAFALPGSAASDPSGVSIGSASDVVGATPGAPTADDMKNMAASVAHGSTLDITHCAMAGTIP